MKKHFITITLLLLCLLSARPADARLTLGVVIGPEGASGSLTREQAQSLANLLVEKLQEDVEVREMADIASMINWLDQFASLDLALMSANDIAGRRGRLLLIGPLDKEGNVNLVTRQGIGGDLPQRAARVVREIGLSPWRAEGAEIEHGEDLVIEEPAAAVGEARTIDEVIAAQVESSVPVVPLPSKAEAKSPARPVRIETVSTKKLVLAVIPELGGALQTTAQAEGVASYLEGALPVTIQVKEFDRADDFTAWFMRYRMVDLAVLPRGFADANLGRDYTALAKLVRAEMPSEAEPELLIGRINQDPALQEQLRAVLLGMMQTDPGTELLTRLNLRQVLDPQAATEVLLVDSTVPEAFEPSDAAIVERVEPGAEGLPVELETEPQVVAEAPAPVEPVAPADIVEVPTPELPEMDVTTLPPEPASPDLIPALPAAAVLPASPLRPDLPGRPAMADVPQQGAAAPVSPIVPPGVPPIALPALPDTFKEPSQPAKSELAREPELPAAPLTPDAPEPVVVQAPDELAISVDAQPVGPVTPSAGELPELPEVSTERVVPSPEVAAVQPPVVPLSVPVPVQPEAAIQAQPVAPAQIDQPEAPLSVPGPDSVATEQEQIVEELLQFAEPASPQVLSEIKPVIIDSDALQEAEIIAILGEDTVASMVAQPDIPQELRPPGVPVIRPGRTASAIDQGLLLTALPDPIPQKEPTRPSSLLPEAEPEPGVIYIMPFVSVMVPKAVSDRIFDQFVDTLIAAGEGMSMQFVILKEGLQKVSPDWLAVRRYVTGEIYAYVEDSGSTATDLRAKARLTYHKPYADQPAFGFMYPFSKFLDNNVSTIEQERIKLADDVATTLSGEFLKALQN